MIKVQNLVTRSIRFFPHKESYFEIKDSNGNYLESDSYDSSGASGVTTLSVYEKITLNKDEGYPGRQRGLAVTFELD